MGVDVELSNVSISYSTRKGPNIAVVDGLSAMVPAGGSLAIVGPSGSGKSSVLNVVSGLVRPTAGQVRVGTTRVDQMTAVETCDLRRQLVGFVFQAFHLLPHLSAAENVALGAQIKGMNPQLASREATKALSEVGLAHRASHRPSELSGGEQQRVALARVYVAHPDVVLADEPTGNLDPAATELVLETLGRLRGILGATLIVATHAPTVAAFADNVLQLGRPAWSSLGSTQSVEEPGFAGGRAI